MKSNISDIRSDSAIHCVGDRRLWGFIRAVKSGQFDDLDTPAHRMLHDDDEDDRPPTD